MTDIKDRVTLIHDTLNKRLAISECQKTKHLIVWKITVIFHDTFDNGNSDYYL